MAPPVYGTAGGTLNQPVLEFWYHEPPGGISSLPLDPGVIILPGYLVEYVPKNRRYGTDQIPRIAQKCEHRRRMFPINYSRGGESSGSRDIGCVRATHQHGYSVIHLEPRLGRRLTPLEKPAFFREIIQLLPG